MYRRWPWTWVWWRSQYSSRKIRKKMWQHVFLQITKCICLVCQNWLRDMRPIALQVAFEPISWQGNCEEKKNGREMKLTENICFVWLTLRVYFSKCCLSTKVENGKNNIFDVGVVKVIIHRNYLLKAVLQPLVIKCPVLTRHIEIVESQNLRT